MGKGCSITWCNLYDHITDGGGIILAAYLVVDNQWHTLQETLHSSVMEWKY